MRLFKNVWMIFLLWASPSLFAQTERDSVVLSDQAFFKLSGTGQRPYLLSILDRQYEFSGLGLDTVYRLPEGMILLESEIVEIERIKLQRGADYQINYRYGEIRFMIPVAEGVQVIVRYQVFPFGFKDVYRYRDRSIVRTIIDTLNRRERILVYHGYDQGENALFGQSNLTGSGSITRGFTIGTNQDFTLNSGLNIQIAGQLTDDVTIEASLTDESTPIQPEGNTETLQEIDKVFIEIRKADRYSATFGDFDFALQGTEFGNYSRKLQGVKAMANTSRIKADIAYAASEGRYATNTLIMAEGVQGPYELSGSNGEKNIIIIAGTEKVWLNGVLMRRGEDQDYVIDYSASQLWFTRRRLIAPESRVVVDFEYTEDLYRRNSLAAKLQSHWSDDKLIIGGVLIHEYDDKNNPINLSLSSQLIDSLSNIDDKTINQLGNVILVSGAVKTAFGRGAYIKVYDEIYLDSIYIYQGSDSAGDYNVRFTNVGNNSGDYVRGLILGEFRYAGKNRGDYLPVVPLTLPTTNTLGAFFVQARPTKAWNVYGEFALSGFDVNAYSPGQIMGKASQFTLRADKQKLALGQTSFGDIDFNVNIRQKDSTFVEVSRLYNAEFNRAWNLNQSLSSVSRSMNREIKQEYSAEYRPKPYIRLAPYYGHLERGDNNFLSNRTGGMVSLNKEKIPFVQYQIDRITTTTTSNARRHYSDVDRQQLITRYRFWNMEPGFEYETEDITNRDRSTDSLTGTSYQTIRPKLDFPGFAKTQFGLSYERRYDRIKNNRIDSLDGTVSIASTSRLYWTISNWKNLTSNIELTQRKKEYIGKFRTADNPDKITRLMNSTADYSPLNRAVQVSMNYQVSEEQIQNRKIIFIPVGSNQGNYVQVAQDSFRQVPQGQGDWIQGSVRANRFTPVVELSAGFRLRVELYRWLIQKRNEKSGQVDSVPIKALQKEFWSWLLMNTAYETFIRVEENQKQPEWSFYFLNWNVFQQIDNTIRGSILLRQDVIFFPQLTQRTVRLRYEHQLNLTNLLVDGRDQRNRVIRNIRWREQVSLSWSMEHELEYETHRRSSSIAFNGSQPDFSIRRIKGMPSVSFRPKSYIELIARSQWIRATEDITHQRATILSIQPEINYAFKSKGRLTANAEVIKVRLKLPGALTLYELADGNQKGTTYRWMIHSDYRIGDHVSAGMNYSGRKEPGQDIIHIASAELRAFF